MSDLVSICVQDLVRSCKSALRKQIIVAINMPADNISVGNFL